MNPAGKPRLDKERRDTLDSHGGFLDERCERQGAIIDFSCRTVKQCRTSMPIQQQRNAPPPLRSAAFDNNDRHVIVNDSGVNKRADFFVEAHHDFISSQVL